jgi:hypothetical protein
LFFSQVPNLIICFRTLLLQGLACDQVTGPVARINGKIDQIKRKIEATRNKLAPLLQLKKKIET